MGAKPGHLCAHRRPSVDMLANSKYYIAFSQSFVRNPYFEYTFMIQLAAKIPWRIAELRVFNILLIILTET